MATKKANGATAVRKLSEGGGGVEAPPGHAPSVPAEWEDGGRPRHVPTEQQVRDASNVAREIAASKTYAADFGKHAPAASAFAAELQLAKAWSDEAAAADAWSSYASDRRDRAWEQALTTAVNLQEPFGMADSHDPAVAKTYPQTKAFLDVRAKAARKAAATRASNKKKPLVK